MSWTVVIPSRLVQNLVPCLEAVYENEPEAMVIVVDDGLEYRPPGPIYLGGVKPFNFSRNCNIGLESAEPDDVMLLNDDAVLETPGGFSGLAAVAKAEPGFGLISAACNNVGNINQWRRPGGGLRQEARMVCFVSVFIPRATIDKVGLLDPIFTGYGFEDDDYSVRVRRAGLKIGIWDGCFVDHSKLRSTFRDYGVAGATELASGAKIFREKWGTDNWRV